MSTPQHRLALPAGYELGRYRFREILGSGGFGITYLAEDQTLNRRVAIKELLPNDIATRIDGTTVVAKTQSEEESLTWARQRFVDEGRALAACDHPNVVNVYEMVEANGTAYMVTKYEDGRSLEQWLRDLGRPPNETELRSVLIPLLDGLETVHQAGFLHRDIKPENIYITKNGRPVLLDFGSARQAITNRSMAMTSIVTSGYAPFEQYHEDGKQGAWSDIYALAAVMYRAITGKKPPEATRRLKDDPCEKLTGRYAGQYDAEFLRAIDKGLLVDEAKRPQSVAAWRKMFGAEDRLPLDSAETRLLPRAPKQPSKIDMFADPGVIAGAVGAVLFIALIWVTVRSGTGRAIASNAAPKIAQTSPSPGEAEASPHASGMPAYSPAEITPAPSPLPSASPSQQAVAQLDPRLVGTWEAKIRWPPAAAPDKPNDITGTWKDADNSTWTFSADGTCAFKDATGRSRDGTAHWQISGSQITVRDDRSKSLRYQLALSSDGRKLSGEWSVASGAETGPVNLERGTNNSGRLQQMRWEQSADGHYVFSGPISDTGVVTGGDDGKFQQFSNAANQPVQVSYEFKGDKLVTNGPLGQAEWHRTGSTTSSKRQSSSPNQSTPRRGYKVRDDDIRNNVIKRVLRRFP